MRRLCRSCECVLYCFIVIYYCYHYYYLLLLTVKLILLTFKRAFKWASRRVNLIKQPPLLPGRLKEGRYLMLKVGVIDRGE